MRTLALGSALVFAGVLTMTSSMSISADKKSPGREEFPRDVVLSVPVACGRSLEDTRLILEAARTNDREGLASLVARGRAFLLSKGTRVTLYARSEEFVALSVRSGEHIGKQGYAPSRMID